MPPLTPTQKSLLTQFMSITGVPERNATKLLKTSGWKLEQACESYVETPIAIYVGMDPIRVTFESRSNCILPQQDICDVRVNQALRHFWLSRLADWGDITQPPSTYKLGDVANQHGARTMWLLDMLSSGNAVPASNKEVNYIISLSPRQTMACQTFNTFEDIIMPPNPPPNSPSGTKSDGHHLPFPRPKGRYQSFKAAERSWRRINTNSSLIQLVKGDLVDSCVLSGSPAVAKAPFKLDPTLMFELRNPIVMTSWISSSLLEEFFASESTDHLVMSYDEWLRRRVGGNADWSPNSYFGSNGTPPMAKEKDALGKLFEKYRDPNTDEVDNISVEGTMKYLADLGINMENAEFLVPLEIVQAPALGEITKDGFVDGWKNINGTAPDTIAKQKAYVAGQIKLMKTDMALFKRVYRHAFICSKEKGQKALALENALVYWEMLFGPSGKLWVTPSTNWIETWLEFLKAKWTKSVNKDMWNQTFEFFQKSLQDESLSFWSEDGAWPGVIDDFVAYAKEKRGDVPESMETD